jgi:hypothetical protein
MTEEEEARIYQRLEQALQMIFDEAMGCWFIAGAQTECYYDGNLECYTLEAWPNIVVEEEKSEGNGQKGNEIYELAEFDFLDLLEEIDLTYFHFSQAGGFFDIGWDESGINVALRLNIKPKPGAEPIAELVDPPAPAPTDTPVH